MAPKPARQPLAEFAKTDRRAPGFQCWLCTIPERAEVEAAVAAGVQKSVARRWLMNECGYGTEATANRVEHHFREHIKTRPLSIPSIRDQPSR